MFFGSMDYHNYEMVEMKRIITILLLFLPVILSACTSRLISADDLPWVGDGPVLFKDDFSRDTGGWTTHEDSLSFSGYAGDGFRLWANVPNYQIWSLPGLNFKDTFISTRARKVGGPDNNLFGLICRYQDPSNYYALVIGSDGYYGIYKVWEGKQTLIGQVHMDFHEAINRGEAENNIQALCKADQLVLLVNGTKLIQVQDDSLSFGDVGLIAGNFSSKGVDILFEDFIVVKP